MARILESVSRSLTELRLMPGYTPPEVAATRVDLETPLCRVPNEPGATLRLRTPVASAAMQAVTGAEMAIAMARLGGIGVLPVSQPIDAQCAQVASVKRYQAGFQRDLVTLHPDRSLEEVARTIRATGYRTFPVTDTGLFHGKLLGVLTDKDFDLRADLDFRVADRMRKDVQVAVGIDDLSEAHRTMIRFGRGFLPIVSEEGTLRAVVFQKDRDKHLQHPDETVDAGRRLRVAAAVSTHPEDVERVEALCEQGVDAIVIDASDGHTGFQAERLREIRERSDVPVIAGNVVTREGFSFLADHGADAVKVGMGIGSGCTTQSVKATGRGQATAIAEVAAARDARLRETGERIPLIADGGVSGSAAMVVALALGADVVMCGNLLARFDEAPGRRLRRGGRTVKEYWMEGSRRAHNARRYAQSADTFFEEGVEGTVPWAGSLYDGLPAMLHVVRAALSTAGCGSLEALHRDACLEPISGTGIPESEVRDLDRLEVDASHSTPH